MLHEWIDGIKYINDFIEKNNINAKLNLGDVKKIIHIIHEIGCYVCKMHYEISINNKNKDKIILEIYKNEDRVCEMVYDSIYPIQTLISFTTKDNDLLNHMNAALIVY